MEALLGFHLLRREIFEVKICISELQLREKERFEDEAIVGCFLSKKGQASEFLSLKALATNLIDKRH